MSAGWIIAGASARGASHVRNGRPNQDAFASTPLSDGIGIRIAAAVSDGHGATPHFRSHIGSRLAVDGAVGLLAWQLDDADADEADIAIAGEIVAHWRSEVAIHAAANPYSDAEALIPRADAFSPYGATLVAFGATQQMIVALQIGDGDLMLGYPDGRIERPIGSDAGLVGEETYSLCLPDAVARFRSATAWRSDGVAWPDFLCATTDGVAKSFQDDDAFTAAIAQLRRNALADWKGLVEALPDWLSELSERGSGDDATICIALDATLSRGS